MILGPTLNLWCPTKGTRLNLIVKNKVYVNRILIYPVSKKATSVEYQSVIDLVGVIYSPKLLILSEVGPAEELKKQESTSFRTSRSDTIFGIILLLIVLFE